MIHGKALAKHSHSRKALSFWTKWNIRVLFVRLFVSPKSLVCWLIGWFLVCAVALYLSVSRELYYRATPLSWNNLIMTPSVLSRFQEAESIYLKICYIVLGYHRKQETIDFNSSDRACPVTLLKKSIFPALFWTLLVWSSQGGVLPTHPRTSQALEKIPPKSQKCQKERQILKYRP